MYCPNCNLLVSAPSTRCPICRSKLWTEPRPEDYCYLVEKESIWASVLSDILTQNNIPFTTQTVLGAAMTLKTGAAHERVRFYVPYAQYDNALDLEHDFFSADAQITKPEEG